MQFNQLKHRTEVANGILFAGNTQIKVSLHTYMGLWSNNNLNHDMLFALSLQGQKLEVIYSVACGKIQK